MMRCPLCNRVMLPTVIVRVNGQLQQMHFWVANGTPPPQFCTGHNKYDPVFYHDEPHETRYALVERTPVPQAFYRAFESEEVPGD